MTFTYSKLLLGFRNNKNFKKLLPPPYYVYDIVYPSFLVTEFSQFSNLQFALPYLCFGEWLK